MPRLLIQSRATGRFLAPNPEDGQPVWVLGLRAAALGIMEDADRVAQLLEDHTEFDDLPQVVDLDRLGTPDY